MPSTFFKRVTAWHAAGPVAALAVLAGAPALPSVWWAYLLIGAALVAAVLAAVHHAEVIALRVGEPFGTLVLALAVTVIEVALIVSLMLSGGPQASAVARDTVYAAVMIVCNGVVGLCLLAGALRHHTIAFRVEGAVPTLTVLAALAVLTLVLPSFTVSAPGPAFSVPQLVFAGLVSLGLYGAFVFVQTIRHRDYFLPEGGDADKDGHADPPTVRATAVSGALLVASLVGVVGLAKTLAPAIRAAVQAAGAPASAVGVIVAVLVLLPETGAALRNALRNRMQTSLNLALGSGLATIGLTIPAVAAVSILMDLPLALGLHPKDMVLLTLTLLISAMTLGGGRATILQGWVHLALFAVFLFMAVVP